MSENEITADGGLTDGDSPNDRLLVENGSAASILFKFLWVAAAQCLSLFIRTFMYIALISIVAGVALAIYYHKDVIKAFDRGDWRVLLHGIPAEVGDPAEHPISGKQSERAQPQSLTPAPDGGPVDAGADRMTDSPSDRKTPGSAPDAHRADKTANPPQKSAAGNAQEHPEATAGSPASPHTEPQQRALNSDAQVPVPQAEAVPENNSEALERAPDSEIETVAPQAEAEAAPQIVTDYSSKPTSGALDSETQRSLAQPGELPDTKKDYSSQAVEQAITKWSRFYQVDSKLAMAVAQHESNLEPLRSRFEPDYYNCYVLGQNGCNKLSPPEVWKPMLKDESGRRMLATSWGLFQLMPATAAMIAKEEGILDRIQTIPMLFEVDLNARLGIAYLKHCLDRSNTFEELGKCYNGSSSVDWWLKVRELLSRNLQ